MNANEFVLRLANAAPSVDDYYREGLSETEAAQLRGQFFCPRRMTPLALPADNELFTLFKDWETKNLEIGMVRFLSVPVSVARGTQVGEIDLDPVVVSSASGEVIVEEHRTNGHVLWLASRDACRFLHAMVVAAEFLASRAKGQVDHDNYEAANRAAQECAEFAGGNRYLDFFVTLLG